MALDGFTSRSSDDRFVTLFEAAAPIERGRGPRPSIVKAEDGTRLAAISDDARRVTLTIDKKGAGDFGAFLVEQLPSLFATFKARDEVPQPPSKGAS